jgi:hypothetical protein
MRFERIFSLKVEQLDIWTILLNQERITVLSSEPGPFPTLGHSSYTNQSAPWRECINPKE